MKISKVLVQRGKRIKLENEDIENFEIQMDAEVEEKDDPQDIIQGLKAILDRHLLAWEQKVRGNDFFTEKTNEVTIKTAEELVDNIDENEQKKPISIEIATEKKQSELEQSQLICPKCNEIMVKKEGKDYYLCSKHWGYPDMIKSGQVREKRF